MFKLDFPKSKFVYLICLLFFSILNHAQKSLRIGYVNMDYILENLDDYKTATEEYEIRLNIWKKEISEREVEIENKLKELEIQRPLLTETLYNDFREEIDFEKEHPTGKVSPTTAHCGSPKRQRTFPTSCKNPVRTNQSGCPSDLIASEV